jgi:hypothetical protein
MGAPEAAVSSCGRSLPNRWNNVAESALLRPPIYMTDFGALHDAGRQLAIPATGNSVNWITPRHAGRSEASQISGAGQPSYSALPERT